VFVARGLLKHAIGAEHVFNVGAMTNYCAAIAGRQQGAKSIDFLYFH